MHWTYWVLLFAFAGMFWSWTTLFERNQAMRKEILKSYNRELRAMTALLNSRRMNKDFIGHISRAEMSLNREASFTFTAEQVEKYHFVYRQAEDVINQLNKEIEEHG